jgi:hypothetical protein
MQGGSDDRAVAVQVGAIILFAFVIIAIAGYQASVVPDQNEQIEFNHNQEAQRQLQDLQGAIGSTPTAGGAQTVVVESSTSYPARTIFVNPPRVTGRLRTVGTSDPAVAIEVRNATAVGETSDFWSGATRNYSTGAFAFDPNYNVYSEAPRTFVSYSLVYNEFRSGEDIVVNAQSIFDGRRISLVALNGSYDEQGGAASVTVRPVSASNNRVTVESESSTDPLSVAIVSRLDASQWETVLDDAGEYDENNNTAGAYVTAVRKKGEVTVPGGQTLNRIEFELEGGTTYSLSLAKAGVGTNVNATPSDRYVTTVSAKNVSTTAGAKETLTVEVRDEFNNPLAGVPMNATVELASGQPGSISEPNGTETGDDGRVGFTYEAPDASTDALVNVSISKAGGQQASVTFNVSVSKASGGGGGGNGAYNVTLVDPSTIGSQGSAVNCPNWPSNRTCIVDGSQLSAVNVTMGTSPTAVGATVSWAVNNSTVATVDPGTGETQGNGENSTDVVVNENGSVVVYASSGAGGNRTTLRVGGVPGGPQPGIVYVNENDYLRSIDSNGRIYEFGSSGKVTAQAVGPMDADIDGDGKVEVPYVDGNGALKIRDMDGEVQELLSSGVSSSSRLAVGAYRTGDPEVYYSDGSNLYHVDWEGGSTTGAQAFYKNPGNNNNKIQAQSVAGVGDFDDADGDTEVVYVNSNSNLAYLNEKSNGQNEAKEAVNQNVVGPQATSELAQLDGDGNADVVWRNGNQPHVRLADANGEDSQLPGMTDKPKSGASMGLYDIDGDTDLELVYVDQGNFLKYYDFATDSMKFVRDENGDKVTVTVGPGGAA